MPKLKEIQTLFSQAFNRKYSDLERSNDFLEQIAHSDALGHKKRFEIYKNNIMSGLNRHLEHTYPVSVQVLGLNYFRQLSKNYINHNPSIVQDLNTYGSTFPEYLKTIVESCTEAASLPYLPDLAHVELLWHQSFYDKEDLEFDFLAFERSSKINNEHIKFHLSSSSYIFTSIYPIAEIWHAHQSPDLDFRIVINNDPEYLFIYRKDWIPKIEKISKFLWQTLSLIQQGATLLELSEHIAQQNDISESEKNSVIPDLIRRGWIANFS